MEGEGSGGLGCAPGGGRSASAARGSGRRRRGSSHGGHGPASGGRGARQTRELKAAAAPASSELDGALRLPWRGGFGSGIQTTSSISIACPCSALFVLPQWRARRPFIGGARRWPWQISRRPLYNRSVLHVGPGQHELHSHAHTREETEVEDEQWTRVLLATNAPAAGRPVCWLY